VSCHVSLTQIWPEHAPVGFGTLSSVFLAAAIIAETARHVTVLRDMHFANPREGWVIGAIDRAGDSRRDDLLPAILRTDGGGLGCRHALQPSEVAGRTANVVPLWQLPLFTGAAAANNHPRTPGGSNVEWS